MRFPDIWAPRNPLRQWQVTCYLPKFPKRDKECAKRNRLSLSYAPKERVKKDQEALGFTPLHRPPYRPTICYWPLSYPPLHECKRVRHELSPHTRNAFHQDKVWVYSEDLTEIAQKTSSCSTVIAQNGRTAFFQTFNRNYREGFSCWTPLCPTEFVQQLFAIYWKASDQHILILSFITHISPHQGPPYHWVTAVQHLACREYDLPRQTAHNY